MARCPFCKSDPYHYVDIGVGHVPAAVDCCDIGVALSCGDKEARQTLRNMRSPSPRRKAKAMKVLREYGYHDEARTRNAHPIIIIETRVREAQGERK